MWKLCGGLEHTLGPDTTRGDNRDEDQGSHLGIDLKRKHGKKQAIMTTRTRR